MTDLNKTDLDELYQEYILEHWRNPLNFDKKLTECQCKEGKNPMCGDHINLCIKIHNEIIEDISFTGDGCAISIASTSTLTNYLKNKNVIEAQEYINYFITHLTTNEDINQEYEPLNIFNSLKNFPLRIKCATLSWRVAQKILENSYDN